MRSTITSFEYMEKAWGWRLRHSMIRKYGLSESLLQNSFAPVSVNLIRDVADDLRSHGFTETDLFRMGVHSYAGNKFSLVGEIYRGFSDHREAFRAFAEDLMPMFERNCAYQFEMIDESRGVVTCRSNRDVADDLGVQYVGSKNLCHVKNGIWASIVLYYGLNLPRVDHFACEHRGDPACKTLFDFSTCERTSGRPKTGLAANE